MIRSFKSFALAAVASIALTAAAQADSTGLPGSMAVGGSSIGIGTAPTFNGSSSIGSAAASSAKNLGIGSDVRHAPAYTSTYSVTPSFSGGSMVVSGASGNISTYPPPTIFPTNNNNSASGLSVGVLPSGSNGFVQPLVISQPSFVAPNYYLPGDFYQRSTYYTPNSGITSSSSFAPPTMNRSLGNGGLLNNAPGGYHSQLSHGVIPNR